MSIQIIEGLTVDMEKPGCYLLHFAKDGESERYKHAAHYLGQAPNLRKRLWSHDHGRGANLTQVVTARGYALWLARVWPAETWGEARAIERKLKKQGGRSRMCPICKEIKKAQEARARGEVEEFVRPEYAVLTF